MRSMYLFDCELGAGGAPVIIVGTGRMALLAHTALVQEGIAITAFCDLTGKNRGLEIMGKPVIGADDVLQRPDAHLVYAGEDLGCAERDLAPFAGMPVWMDRHAYGIVNDCAWSFM